MLIWCAVVVIALVIAAAVVRTPSVTEQEALNTLKGPGWKSWTAVAKEIRGDRVWIVWPLLIWRVSETTEALIRKGKMDFRSTREPGWQTSEFRAKPPA